MNRAAEILNSDLDFGNPKVIEMVKETLQVMNKNISGL
jgi:hypothetical protein